jgi:hypothetical protein
MISASRLRGGSAALRLTLLMCGLAGAEAGAVQLTASWVDNAAGTAITRIERRLTGTGAFIAIADVPPGATAYTDGAVTAGTTYCYRVLAYNGEGVSPYSNEACATPAGDGFVDVPPTHPFFPWIEAMVPAGLTTGCSTNPPMYCPDAVSTRREMAVFLLRGIHGAGYRPPPATGMFADVPLLDPLAPWIEQLARDGITAGCATNPLLYCPDTNVTRAQVAVFLLRATHGSGYVPPPAVGTMFADVPGTHPLARWIEQLAREGVTGGCASGPAQYCPDAAVTRGQMAVFLVRAFGLPL